VSTVKKLLFGVKLKSEVITAVGDRPHLGKSYFREWLAIFFSLFRYTTNSASTSQCLGCSR
jgi:hypothetical protein